MSSKEKLQSNIIENEGLIFSDGTLNLNDLLSRSHDFLISWNIGKTDLIEKIRELFVPTDEDGELEEALSIQDFYGEIEIPDENIEEANYIWNEDIFYLFNDVSPDGYYFGSSEGDGALIGWFEFEEEEIV